MAFVGDPQADNATQVTYARKSIYKELRERKDIDLVIVLGDLVNDKPELIEPSVASLDSLPCPWFAVPGNHDRDNVKGEFRGISRWKEVLGYQDTTFVMHGIRFILMNDVRTKGRADYEAGLLETQKEWLQEVMDATPSGQQIVFASHIPLTEMHAKDSLEMMFKGKDNVLLVSGHTHQVRRELLTLNGRKVENLVAGATCGSWWRGFKDSIGVPDALMNCGSPRGYFICDFKPAGYSLKFKKVSGDENASATVTEDGRILVNVYGGSIDGHLSARIPGLGRISFRQNYVIAPEVQERIDFNEAMTKEYRKEHKEEYIPMRKLASPHVWEAQVDDPGALKGKKIAVMYDDGTMKFKKRLLLDQSQGNPLPVEIDVQD